MMPVLELGAALACAGGLIRRSWQGPLFVLLFGALTTLTVYLLIVALAGDPTAECGCFGRFRGMSVVGAAVRNMIGLGVIGAAIAMLSPSPPTS